MGQTEIEWADYTFNAWEGCQKVSPGCKNCYAESRDKWLHRGDHWGPDSVRLEHGDKYWEQPLKWDAQAAKAGRIGRVFCQSLGDILEPGIRLDGLRSRVFAIARVTKNLIWLFLTKRMENALDLFPPDWIENWPGHVMLGYTAENDQTLRLRHSQFFLAHQYIGGLRGFISAEPLLTGLPSLPIALDCPGIEWVIGAGESGDNARPPHPEWFREIQVNCMSYGVPFLFKQWGEWRPPLEGESYTTLPLWRGPAAVMVDRDNATVHCFQSGNVGKNDVVIRVGKKEAGRLLDGKEYNELPVDWPGNVGMPPRPKKVKTDLVVLS